MKHQVNLFILNCISFMSRVYLILFNHTEFLSDYSAFSMQQEEIDSEEGRKCFFRVTLEGCSQGDEIITFSNEKVMTTEVGEETSSVCLPAMCSSSDGSLMLSDEVIIGGEKISANPGSLSQSTAEDSLYNSQSECMGSEKVVSMVKCLEGATDSMLILDIF